jgi:HAD superfamily hydrolase (TIGR01509 family)
MPILLAFDFDGVIVDSIQLLKDVYYDFLSEFRVEGNELEFQLLNGPSITEVVSILKEKYQIEESYEELLKNYKIRLNQSYIEAPLVDNALLTLQTLRERNIDLALVTSSVRSDVEAYLRKYGIENIFKYIVTGNEVSSSKPSPDIYLKVKEKFPDHKIWAIEDSENGIKAAMCAGIKVIFFDQFCNGTKSKIDCRINSLNDVTLFVETLNKNYFIVERSTKISVKVKEEYFPKLNYQQDLEVKRIWEEALNSKALHDDQVLYYLSHVSDQKSITINAFWGPYKYFFSRLQKPLLGIDFIPLAVSGICRSRDGLVLIAERKNVTEYEARKELVPSGGISASVQEGTFVDFKRQLVKELLEETSLTESSISKVNEIGIVKDINNNVIDLCCLLDLCDDGKLNSELSAEYSYLKWVDVNDLSHDEVIPTSLGVLNLSMNLGVF